MGLLNQEKVDEVDISFKGNNEVDDRKEMGLISKKLHHGACCECSYGVNAYRIRRRFIQMQT